VEDFYRTLFDAIPAYVTVQDGNLRITEANRRFTRDFADGVGTECYRSYKRRDRPCEVCPVLLSFGDGQPHMSEEKVTTRDGRVISTVVHTSPIRDETGRIVSVMEVSTDVTGLKQLQEEYRTLFTEAPCYISVQDRGLRILEANRRFRDDFGEPAERHCYEVYKHRDEPCLVCPVAKTFEDGGTHTSEEEVTALDGRQICTLVSTAPLRGPSGEVAAVMEMSANVTELRQVQSQLASLGMVVGSISHGIKGLLNGLGGGVYLMDTGFAKQDLARVRTGWEMTKRNVDRIRGMVLNVLYYARDREMQREEVDLAALAEDAVSVVRSRAEQAGVALAAPAGPSAGRLSADPRALHSLLVNLLENSLDACRVDRKKESHRVSLGIERADGEVLFTVEDNGVGMDRETREKVFSAFFSSKGMEGTGLGLFIASRIASAHGGRIDVESRLDVGSRFTVRLPAAVGG
jgi:PAS domain S-box-containing protein